MRILEIMGSLHRGGAETMIMNYYRAFDKEKCQMDFVIHAKFENDYRDEAIHLGAKIIELKRPGELGAIKYIAELSKKIKENGPYKAVHIHTNHQAFLSVIAAHRAGVQNIIVHSHNTYFDQKYIVINRMIMQLYGVKKVSCGIAAGEAFFGKSDYTIINNAIDTNKFRAVSEEQCLAVKKKLFGDAIVVGHIGRMTKQKNHDFIIKLMEKLILYNDNIIVACYGEGEDEDRIRSVIQSKGLEKHIRLMGVTNDVITAYHMFDVFILPSLWEGFPVTLVESQLAGVYSLTSDKVSTECDLNIGKLKYLPLEVETWVEAILNTIQDKHSESDNQEVLDAYNVEIQWKKLYEIYCA